MFDQVLSGQAEVMPGVPGLADEYSPADASPLAGFGPQVRRELCDRVRSEIAAGTYETADKLMASMPGLAADAGLTVQELDVLGESETTRPAWMK